MPKKFQAYKKRIDAYLLEFLAAHAAGSTKINTLGVRAYDKLSQFIISGKSLRGGLVLWASEAVNKTVSKNHIRLACAIELLHSGLLIHDDIMDHDLMRRGEKTLNAQYAEELDVDSPEKKQDFGRAVAICCGDLAFFLGFELVSQINANSQISQQLNTVAREFSSVCLAQMQDVTFAYQNTLPQIDEVLNMYTYKTARYTFSFPLIIGAQLSGVSKNVLDQFDELGNTLGLIFQLSDDMLNLYGVEKISGKSKGSDLREQKKTYAYVSLLHSMNEGEHKTLRNHVIEAQRISYLYNLLEKYNIRKNLQLYINTLSDKATSQIQTLCVTDAYKSDMQNMVSFLRTRSI